MEVPVIERVLGYSKVNKKFPTYKEKLQLFYSYDLFFCDYKIYNLMKNVTGKVFYERKKIPFPIDCEKTPEFIKEKLGSDDYQSYLNDLSNYSYFIMGNGPVYTLKVARVNMESKSILKNIFHAVYHSIPHLLINSNIKHNSVR